MGYVTSTKGATKAAAKGETRRRKRKRGLNRYSASSEAAAAKAAEDRGDSDISPAPTSPKVADMVSPYMSSTSLALETHMSLKFWAQAVKICLIFYVHFTRPWYLSHLLVQSPCPQYPHTSRED